MLRCNAAYISKWICSMQFYACVFLFVHVYASGVELVEISGLNEWVTKWEFHVWCVCICRPSGHKKPQFDQIPTQCLCLSPWVCCPLIALVPICPRIDICCSLTNIWPHFPLLHLTPFSFFCSPLFPPSYPSVCIHYIFSPVSFIVQIHPGNWGWK